MKIKSASQVVVVSWATRQSSKVRYECQSSFNGRSRAPHEPENEAKGFGWVLGIRVYVGIECISELQSRSMSLARWHHLPKEGRRLYCTQRRHVSRLFQFLPIFVANMSTVLRDITVIYMCFHRFYGHSSIVSFLVDDVVGHNFPRVNVSTR